MQARYYDPVIGRFYSNDPLGFRDIHSFNRYAYANNNPYKYTDPTGMASNTRMGKEFEAKKCRQRDNCEDSTSNSRDSSSNHKNSTGAQVAATTAVIGRASSTASVVIPKWARSPWGLVLMAVLPTKVGDGTLSQEQLAEISTSQCLPVCTLADSSQIPVGSISYRLDIVPPSTPHYPFSGDHAHLYRANQNPNNCQCFWKEFDIVEPPPPTNAIPIQPFIR